MRNTTGNATRNIAQNTIISTNAMGEQAMNKEDWLDLLFQEFFTYKEELFSSGAGLSLLQRTLIPPHRVQAIEEKEAALGKEKIKELVIKVLARYILLVNEDRTLFYSDVENGLGRALFNNGIEDEELRNWCWEHRKYMKEGKPKPTELQKEIDSLLSLCDICNKA